MKKFYFEMKRGLWSVAMLLGLLCSVSLASCGDDDDKPGGQSVTTDNLVGRSFRCDWTDINDDNLPVEEHKEITFTSTTQCSIRSWGYDWVWYDSYEKENYNETKTCSYSVSGDKITLHNYPFFAFGGDLELTYCGDFLMEGDNIYKE